MEIDHVFVLCGVNAPEADALTRLGFVEGSPNAHPGQGTACRRFFFRSSYLELPWVDHEEDAQREAVRRTGLWERWSNRRNGACPFGIVLRPRNDAIDAAPPFTTWSYTPSYLPPPLSIDVAADVSVTEPAFFWLAFARGRRPAGQEPTSHRLGRTITSIRIGTPAAEPRSEAARLAQAAGVLSFDVCGEHILDVTLDGGTRGQSIDARPTLPIRWHT